jgi:hypothetical protein
MENEWVNVFVTSQPYRAELAKQVLEQSDIDAVLLNKRDSFYHVGDIEVHVKQDNVIKAKNVLKTLDD